MLYDYKKASKMIKIFKNAVGTESAEICYVLNLGCTKQNTS